MTMIAVDTGGTFTDVVCLRDGSLRTLKVPSTPDDPAQAVLTGIAEVLNTSADRFVLVHGSTVATNTLLERKGAVVALVTNAGFEDVLEIGRQNRPQLYALVGHRPPPLVPRERRHGIRGRLGPVGEELEPLDTKALASLAERLGDAESIAICMLHSYANPAHELEVARGLERLGVPVSLSSEILPEFREYERTATTVVNAYVAPVTDRYLGRLAAESKAERVRIMASSGGVMALSRARRDAVHTVLSGPAGGVSGALAVARAAGFRDILTFDMGGTSTDVSLCPGRPLHTREFRIADVPVAIPVLDIHTVGAGGGSIARIDVGGALHVGPESAGARPGPICYGRGGTAVTVTDANVWLGRLPVDVWPHGRLDRESIARPLASLARAMGATPEEAAEGIISIVNTAMEGALRVISVERGHDPRDFTLVCFGGAAGLHAVALASRLGIPRVLVPPAPGVLSAYGMLVAPVRKDVSRTVLRRTRTEAELEVEGTFAELEAHARAAMDEEGVADADVTVTRRIDARYEGQSYELTVPAANWVAAFHAAHEGQFGFSSPGAVLEAVSLRVEALAPPASAETRLGRPPLQPGRPAGTDVVLVPGRPTRAARWIRDALAGGQRIEGPSLVAEYSSTLWIPPGVRGSVLDDGSILLETA